MSTTPRIADERHRYILKELQERGSCKVAELARALNVSEMTIHRDLAHLARQNLLRKVHGGAVLRNYIELTFADRAVQNHEAKVAVAQRAQSLVRPGTSLYLSPGSTAHEFALALAQEDLHVYTNSLPTATALARSTPQGLRVTLLGGDLVGFVEALVGPATEAALADLKLSYAFIAVTGVSLEGGLTIYTEEEARVIRAVIRAARKTVLLTDASKFGQVVGPQVGHLEDMHVVVSDTMPEAYRRRCEQHDVEVMLVAGEPPVMSPAAASAADQRN
ncbi:DeoR/GlpR family transcriptional regulator of sugar metabolism [Deinococcus metalli]|uniref:DeoR family transcriptional regulator n=1 Tax=Deinococcus metalli TaxID=1141878 RepID=A0A7W8NRE6_9DEIO|nr:DeoR/GlpR family DNA-binding transcription regulator [Deinococcus metalli]MBB5376803.1 DeoR/GlpR family transcriptional regulator of sugar metabolism [Deinococcus metalli]GHF45460.1 DeoR family transcriptional regulator [Deinococcus metalli]